MELQEILEKLKAHYKEELSEFAYADEGSIDGLGSFTEIAQKGGEGEGEEWYSVKHFPDHNLYVKVNGAYYSYDGTNFDGWEEDVKLVKPSEKTITVYE